MQRPEKKGGGSTSLRGPASRAATVGTVCRSISVTVLRCGFPVATMLSSISRISDQRKPTTLHRCAIRTASLARHQIHQVRMVEPQNLRNPDSAPPAHDTRTESCFRRKPLHRAMRTAVPDEIE